VFADDPDSELNEMMQATFSDHQRRKNAEQSCNRTRARLMNGYWPFPVPKGYKYVKKSGCGKVLVRDEPIASGRFQTQVEVQRYLESQRAYPKDRPNGKFHQQRVPELFERIIYAGYLEKQDWDAPLRKAQHEGLVSLATFQKVQDRLKANANAPARKDIRKDFPLRNFVFCGDSDKPLTSCWSTSGTKKRKHAYYLRATKGCPSCRKSIRKAQIEGDFEDLLDTLQPKDEVFHIAKDMFQ